MLRHSVNAIAEREDQNGHAEQGEDFKRGHGFSLPRMRLATKCNAVPSESQTSDERAMTQPGTLVTPKIAAMAGAMAPVTITPDDTEFSHVAVSLARSLSMCMGFGSGGRPELEGRVIKQAGYRRNRRSRLKPVALPSSPTRNVT